MYSLVEMAEDDTGEGGDQLIRSKFSSVCELPNRGGRAALHAVHTRNRIPLRLPVF